MNPMFSIVIPIYNAGKYLKKCLDGLKLQTYTDFEVILINDGSKDNSEEICNQYTDDSRFKLINKKNEGVSLARNDGIKNARGKYILFVDSDDIPHINMCEEYYKILKEKEYDLIISGVEKVSEEGYFIDSFEGVIKEGKISKDDLKLYVNVMYKRGVFNCPYSKCFKKSKIKEYYNSKLSLGEDLIFNLNYLEECEEVYYLQKNLYKYIFYKSNSLSSKYREDGFETIFYVYNRSLEIMKDYLNVENKELKEFHAKYALDCIVLMERIARNINLNKKEKIRNISKNKSYFSSVNFKQVKGIKWKVYYLLLKIKAYSAFIYVSNMIRRRKK